MVIRYMVNQYKWQNLAVKIVSVLFFILLITHLFNSNALMAASKNEVNVYSARTHDLIRPILDQFTKQTGIRVNLITGKDDALLKRIEQEGEATPADLFITVDAGRLFRAKEAGLLQPVHSAKLAKHIPENLRDKDQQWFGLSQRIRTVVYAKDRVQPEELSTYENLADPKWRGRICVRSSENIYNQSLVAAMIAVRGVQYTGNWIEGLVENFARKPQGNDRAQIKAVASGACDIAIVNTYYYGMMQHSKDLSEKRAADAVQLVWLNQQDRGAHVNVSGAGVTRYAKNRDHAVELLEFLVTAQAQRFYADSNYEYPVIPAIEPSPTIAAWGRFQADQVHLSDLGPNNKRAVQLMDQYGWR